MSVTLMPVGNNIVDLVQILHVRGNFVCFPSSVMESEIFSSVSFFGGRRSFALFRPYEGVREMEVGSSSQPS